MKYLILIFTFLSPIYTSAQTSNMVEPQWVENTDKDFSYSTSGQGPQGQMNITSDYKSYFFRIVWSNNDYCKGKNENFSELRKVFVDGQPVEFKISCYEEEWVNIHPSKKKGLDYVARTIQRFGNKPVPFMIHNPGGKGFKFEIPSKGFKKFLAIVKKATKPVL